MAASTLPKTQEFLVFPTGSSAFAWRVIATGTGRTVSRYKDLGKAVRKAEELNLRSMFPVLPEPQYAERPIVWTRGIDLGTCQHWYDTAAAPGYANGCDRSAMITDLETGCGFCVEHWKEFNQ